MCVWVGGVRVQDGVIKLLDKGGKGCMKGSVSGRVGGWEGEWVRG